MSDHVLFAIVPYAAGACFLAGIMMRIAPDSRTPDPAASGRAPAAGTRTRLRSRPVLTIGLIGVCAGHVAMFVLPGVLREWNQDLFRLIGLELLLLACGLMVFAALL